MVWGCSLTRCLRLLQPPVAHSPFGRHRIAVRARDAATIDLVVAGGLIPTNSTTVVPFSSADRRRKIASNEVPDQCGNGHRLTPDNVRRTGERAAGGAGSVAATALLHLGIGNGRAECARIPTSMPQLIRHPGFRSGLNRLDPIVSREVRSGH